MGNKALYSLCPYIIETTYNGLETENNFQFNLITRDVSPFVNNYFASYVITDIYQYNHNGQS